MFWVAVASLIMLISGTGDDTRAFRERAEAFKEAISLYVQDGPREARAIAAVERSECSFRRHREKLAQKQACLAKVDAAYAATRQDYLACLAGTQNIWLESSDALIKSQRDLQASITPEEWALVQARVTR